MAITDSHVGCQTGTSLADSIRQRATERLSGGPGDSLESMLGGLLGGGDQFGSSGSRFQGGLSPYQQVNSLVGWVYVCVDRIRNAVMRTPLRHYRTSFDGSKPEEITDPRNELVSLLRNPNPMDTRAEFLSQSVTFYELTGNAIWLKMRDRRNKVRELWNVPTQFVRPGPVVDSLITGYWLDSANSVPIFVPATEIVHHRQPNPKDRFWGLGTLAAAAEAMRSQNAIKAAQLKSFDNDILSSLYFTTDQVLDGPTWQRMFATLRERFSGVQRAGTPVLLYGGVKPAHTNRPPQEMAFKDSSAFTRDEIFGIFGVPPLLGGVVENANNSNTASQERVFGRETVQPKLVLIQERINKDLCPEFDKNHEVEFDSPVPEDVLMQATLDAKDIASGKLTINEARIRDGLKPLPGCDLPRFMIEAQLKANGR